LYTLPTVGISVIFVGLPTVAVSVIFMGLKNKQRLFRCTALTGCKSKSQCFKITVKTQQRININIL
jgi:energy-converting hydrogenase Eha subunit E